MQQRFKKQGKNVFPKIRGTWINKTIAKFTCTFSFRMSSELNEEKNRASNAEVVEYAVISPEDGESTITAIDPNDKANIPFIISVLPAILAGGADYAGLGIIQPLLPFFINSRGEDEEWLGTITSVQFFGIFIGGLVMARIGDIYSLKTALQIAMAADVSIYIYLCLYL